MIINDKAFDERMSGDVVSVESEFVKFSISPEKGCYSFTDKQTEEVWHSSPYTDRMGEAVVKFNGESRHIPLKGFGAHRSGNAIKLACKPAGITITVELLPDGRTAEISYKPDEGTEVEQVRLLDDSIWVTGSSYVLVPVRLGLLVPADSEKTFKHHFPTFAYEGCHMEMIGAVKNASAILVTWHDPYVTAEVQSVLPKREGEQIVSASLIMRKSAKKARIQFLGKGDYVTIAKAYRKVAKDKGWLVTWDEKLKEYPAGKMLTGAINFKLWSMLSRSLDIDSKEKAVNVNWTFDEATEVAKHLKDDLKLDRVLFIMGGWIHRGYDNQHPDILPAAPECGGSDAMAECSRQIQSLGYMLSLHDNYQDIYKDSPSWNEDYIMKRPDGSLVKGGVWAGGQAWLTCSKEAVKLAKRPQNLPAVKELFAPNSYFIDTTYAAGLFECFDPNHPLTMWDDMKYKIEISDYARSMFGNFGSECGREWAIPHSDFFEGLTGVSGRYYHSLDINSMGATVVPLFEIVYRDCIAMYGKYGYDINKSAEYVLHHISIGRPMHYHSVPTHLYWTRETNDELPITETEQADEGYFTRGHNGWAEGLCRFDRFVKNAYEVISPLNEITAKMRMIDHKFLTDDRKVLLTVFRNVPGWLFEDEVKVIVNKGLTEYVVDSKQGGKVVLPPYGFIIEHPSFVAFYALSWNGIEYENPALFTIRSLDGASIGWSSQVRIYHGFGDTRIKIKGEVYEVKGESVID